MAVKKKVSRRTPKISLPAIEEPVIPPPPPIPQPFSPARRGWIKKLLLVLAVLGLLGFWWYRTNTWPVVAVVAGRPLTRYEVNSALYRQGGQAMVESLITRRLVENELDRIGVTVSPDQVNARIEEIKSTLPEGQSLEDELQTRGSSLAEMTELLTLQMRVNAAVESQATVSAQEIDQYVSANTQYLTGKTDAEKRAEAENILKQDKLQSSISSWVDSVRTKGQVWMWPL